MWCGGVSISMSIHHSMNALNVFVCSRLFMTSKKWKMNSKIQYKHSSSRTHSREKICNWAEFKVYRSFSTDLRTICCKSSSLLNTHTHTHEHMDTNRGGEKKTAESKMLLTSRKYRKMYRMHIYINIMWSMFLNSVSNIRATANVCVNVC